MKRIILIEPVLAHYRRDVFERLTQTNEFNLEVVAGEEFQQIKSLKNTSHRTFKFKYFRFINHGFYYMPGLLKYIRFRNPDAIICTGVDFHQLHTIVLFFFNILFYHKLFFWWSHATTGNQGLLGIKIRKLLYRYSTGILAYSKKGRQNLLTFGIPSQNICVVNNSLNADDYGFNQLDVVNKPRTEILKIVFSGRITNSKNIPVLIQALYILKMEKSQKFLCTLVGNGDTTELKQLVDRLDLKDEVKFTGGVYGKDLYPILNGSDIMIYPGGIGLSLVHALSFGIPVITTDNKSLHGPEIELLQQGINGDFFKEGDARNLSEVIVQWNKKLHESGIDISSACVNSIKENNYLPDAVASSAIRFIKEKLAVH